MQQKWCSNDTQEGERMEEGLIRVDLCSDSSSTEDPTATSNGREAQRRRNISAAIDVASARLPTTQPHEPPRLEDERHVQKLWFNVCTHQAAPVPLARTFFLVQTSAWFTSCVLFPATRCWKGRFWEATLAVICVPEILQTPAASQIWNDASRYGPCCELFFSL